MQYKNNKNKKYRAIVVLGGLLKKKSNRSWGSDKFNYVRVLAGYYLYKDLVKSYQIKLIVSGGKGIYKDIPGVPAVATIMKKELVQLGIPKKEIIEENKTASTYRELLWLKKILNKNHGKVIVISNNYHMPRINVMINLIPELQVLKDSLSFVSAEKIVLKYNSKLKNDLEKNKKDSKMKEIITQEKKGVNALKLGNYKFR